MLTTPAIIPFYPASHAFHEFPVLLPPTCFHGVFVQRFRGLGHHLSLRDYTIGQSYHLAVVVRLMDMELSAAHKIFQGVLFSGAFESKAGYS